MVIRPRRCVWRSIWIGVKKGGASDQTCDKRGIYNLRGQTALTIALTVGMGRGGAAVVAADIDSNGHPIPERTHMSTAALLRKLGATQ